MAHFAQLVRILWAAAAVISPMGIAESGQSKGQALYISKGCYACHGYAGQGAATGPRIAGTPLPLEAFAELVRRPANVMPAYSPRVLTDQELRELHTFVQSLR